ncbi:MAG: UDP-N-acetylmuramate--L-alanine ligase [Robiginitomaculum sp.]|nr:MAG: UDP-N-acetylmuramate--L-alanine ligase [Robiginitomaculum sp.]
MRKDLPFDIGIVHFVGIGGIGMSGIAEVMINLGYKVRGSDISDNANVKRLRKIGADIRIGHGPENIQGVGTVVTSTAIKGGNPEVDAARALGIPIVRRAEMLAELMRLKWSVAIAGTHGKTTTTSLVAALLDGAGLDPTVINGGVISAYGSNAKLGGGEWMVVEADESDGSFLKLRGAVAVVTNIDAEHMEHYGSFDALRAAFDQFVEAIPFYGFAVLCLDHPEVQALVARVRDRKVLTYGFTPQAGARIENARTEDSNAIFDAIFMSQDDQVEERWNHMVLPMAGDHNVQNAMAAITVARELGASEQSIRKSLAGFTGVKRRFTGVGNWNGAAIIDDYGHHPVEIAAVLKAARSITKGRVLAVVQPHRYSRLSALFEEFCTCFNDADMVFVTPVFRAGETPIEGMNAKGLVDGLRTHGHRHAELITRETMAKQISEHATNGDTILFMGAGDITYWAKDLQAELEALG